MKKIRIHFDGSLNTVQDEELTNFIANGEVRGDVDVYELGAVLRIVGAERGSFLLDPGSRSAEILADPDAPIDWCQVSWGHEPAS